MRIFVVSLLLALALVLSLDGEAGAALVIFKDGFFLTGVIQQEKEFVVDAPSGEAMVVPKGCIFLDDGARRIFFSHTQVLDVDNKDVDKDADVVKLYNRNVRISSFRVPPIMEPGQATSWNDKWERTYTLETLGYRYQIKQRLGALTPHYARADGLSYSWSEFFLTSELDPEVVRTLLFDHPDLKLKGDKGDAAKRFRVYRFLLQAGWYDQADQELDHILKALPEEKEKVDAARDDLKNLRAVERMDVIERAFRAGQHEWVQRQLTEFSTQGLDEKLLDRMRTLKDQYEAANEDMKTTRRFLQELPPRVGLPAQNKMFVEASASIADELSLDDFLPGTPDNVKRPEHAKLQRLDSFLGLAQQAERDEKQGRPPANGPAQLMALAVTGWLIGKDAAEPKVETATRIWRGRQFILDYQNATDSTMRERLLRSYEMEGTQTLAPDELAHLIGMLPPPEPETNLSSDAVDMQTKLPEGRSRGVRYRLQLPPEYRHGRSYPVLFALHQGGQLPGDILDRFSRLAGQYGYILVAPEWGAANSTYSYSVEEHAAVLDVLRDLRRRFQVDSDRVFLTGFGEGGNMAYDVGLAHPDLFAGVLPIGGQPLWFARLYWQNAQCLPFYVVNGDQTGDLAKQDRRQFNERWVPLCYPGIHVEYKGRGQEWFPSELPYLFQWMDHKMRARAVPDLGKNANGGPLGEEYQTMRHTDNHFYWLSTDAIGDGYVNEGQNWNPKIQGAHIDAHIIGGEDNRINIYTRGFKQLTVWLAPDMPLLFDKPILIQLNGVQMWKQRVQPSRATLLEDYFSRGDRQRLFLAKVDFNRLQ